MSERWDDKYEYLRDSRRLYHNEDYWEFLVDRVWRLTDRPRRVVDFGCGYGRTGLALLPLLPETSTYTGIDASEALLARARQVFAELPYPAEFVNADVHSAPFDDSRFDTAISHTVLMHVPHPEKVIQEMVRVTRHGGMVITCDASRNAFNALFHIHETNEQEQTPLELFQTMNRRIRRQTGVDYNIGLKTPVLMHRAGLKNVQARISDAVRLLFPPMDTEGKAKLFKAICDQGFGFQPTDRQSIRQWQQRLVEQGVPADKARKEIDRELKRDFLHKGREYHTVFPGLLTFSYGTVDKP